MAQAFWASLALVGATFYVYMLGVSKVEGATFEIQNQCPYTVWAAGIPVGGGRELRSGQSWQFGVPRGSIGRVWGRTGCSFDGSGRGRCNTGDCGGVLNCKGSGGVPATLFEYALNQFENKDFYDISLVDGFNLRMSVILSNSQCKRIACNSDVNARCPNELRVRDGCKSPCAVFNTPQYCCTGPFLENCPPTGYSKFFKRECPQAYSYAKDDPTSTFTCPGGSNYKIVFCSTTATATATATATFNSSSHQPLHSIE